MAHNQANKLSNHTEVQSSQEAEELIIKLLPILDKEQLARVVEDIADVVSTSEILN